MPSARLPLHLLCRATLLVVLAAAALPAAGALAFESETLGRVSRIQGEAMVLRMGQAVPLARGSIVRRADVLRTAPGARLELTMLDETRLTLGAATTMAVERYDLGRQKGQGAVLLLLTTGTFRVTTGQLSALRGGPFEILTPLATIGVRGADLWGGFLAPEELGVLLVSGSGAYVRNDGGRSDIPRAQEGVRLNSPAGPPPAPSLWSPDRRAQALRSVAFD